MRKLLSLILALAMCVTLMGCGAAQQAETTAATEAAAAAAEDSLFQQR